MSRMRGARAGRGLAAVTLTTMVVLLAGCAGGSDADSEEPDDAGALVSEQSDSGDASQAGSESPDPAGTPAEGEPTASTEGTTCAYKAAETPGEAVEPPPATPGELPAQAELVTSAGTMTIALNAEAAPCAVNSFASLAEQGYFDGSSCHRLTTQGLFSLQCGDPTGTGKGGPGYAFGSETTGEETYPRGTVAMAPFAPDDNGSQFFLIYQDSELAPKYTILGTLDDEGLQALDAVAEAGTTTGDVDGEPRSAVTIDSAMTGETP